MSEDNHQKEREVLFANEAFAIGLLQAVSSGAVVAAISQFKSISELSGQIGTLTFITFMSVSVIGSVLAAYNKHQYKMWGVKIPCANTDCEKEKRKKKQDSALNMMRLSMNISVVSIILAMAVFLVLSWASVLEVSIKPLEF